MITALAPESQRSWASVTLGFGVLSIRLGVYTDEQDTSVNRTEWLVSDTTVPVGRAAVRKDTGEVISSADVTRMATATSGARVSFDNDEIAACTSKGVADIITFVPTKDVFANYLPAGRVQVRPKAEKGKVNPAENKAFALLLVTLKKKKVQALVSVAMRGPARFALLDSDGYLTFVHSHDQLRAPRALDTDVSFSKAELDLAAALVDAVGTDTPILTDTSAVALQAAVEKRGG
jgi:non-homologous end joining protein Ku